MTSSKIISGDALKDAPTTWRAPEVRAPGPAGDPQQELERLRQEARRQGFDEGREAGLRAGAQEIGARATALENVLTALAKPFSDLDHRVEEEIVALVKAVTRQLVRREFSADPTHLVAIIREGMGALPLTTSAMTVRLHPDDAAAIRECLDPKNDDRPWRIESDPVVERGGCLISSDLSEVDGRLDTRLNRVIGALFDNERAGTPVAEDD